MIYYLWNSWFNIRGDSEFYFLLHYSWSNSLDPHCFGSFICKCGVFEKMCCISVRLTTVNVNLNLKVVDNIMEVGL